MGIFNFFKQTPLAPVVQEKRTIDATDGFLNLSIQTSLPRITESRNNQWVDYGDNNNFPKYLQELYLTSPTQQAIIDTKSLIVAGEGYTYDDSNLTEMQKAELNQFLHFIDGKNSIETFISNISKDLELYGAISIEHIWSLDFTKVVKSTRISPSNIRSGKFEEGGSVEEYFYSRNWGNRNSEKIEIPAFDITNKQDGRQLSYTPLQMVSNEYYGEPQYLASMNWIDLEAQTGLYYKSLLDNGFNPSMVIKFYKKPESIEERDEVVSGLKRSFGGVKNSGKAIVMFSDGKELAPDVDAVAVPNMDKQFTVIGDTIVKKILTGARITTAELFGIETPGSLGSSDFATKVEAFTKFVIAPNQKIINGIINKILIINGLNVDFKITPYELIDYQTNKPTLLK